MSDNANDKTRETIKSIIKFFSYNNPTKWATEQEQFKNLDLKDRDILSEYHQSYFEEKQRAINKLNEVFETLLDSEPALLRNLTEKALSSEINYIIAQASIRANSTVVLPQLVKSFKRVNMRTKNEIIRAVACLGSVNEYSFLKNLLYEEKEQVIRDEATKALDTILKKEPLLKTFNDVITGINDDFFLSGYTSQEIVKGLLNYFQQEEQIRLLDSLKSKKPEIYSEVIKELNCEYRKTKTQKVALKDAKPGDLVIMLATRDEEPPKDIMHEATKIFWGSGKETRIKVLGSMQTISSVRFLHCGLRGTDQQAVFSLSLLKYEYRHLFATVIEDIISLITGDNSEVCCLAGELMLQEKPEYISAYYWLTVRLASIASGDLNLEKRIPLIIALAGLGNRGQALFIMRCNERDSIVEELISRNRYLELLSLIKVSLLRWQTELDVASDLIWLIKTFFRVKRDCKLKESKTSLDGTGNLVDLINENLDAATGVLVRFLHRPGGISFCLNNPWIFEDRELTRLILKALINEPLVYVSLINEAAKIGMEKLFPLKYLLQGILKSEYCLTELIRCCLVTTSKDLKLIGECAEKLNPVDKKILPFVIFLTAEYNAQLEDEQNELFSLKDKIVQRVTVKTEFLISKIKNAIEEPDITPKSKIMGVYADELEFTLNDAISRFEWKPKSIYTVNSEQDSLTNAIQQACSLQIETNRIHSLASSLEFRFLNYLGQSIGLIIEKMQLWLEKNKAIPGFENTLSDYLEELGFKIIAQPGERIPFDPVLHFEQSSLEIGRLVIAKSTGIKGPDHTILRKAVIEECDEGVSYEN